MARVTIIVTGADAAVRVLSSLQAPALHQVFREALEKSALLTQRIATDEKIVHGAETRATKPLPHKLTSRRGGAGLVGSIGIDRSDLPLSVSVGSALKYAPVHEYGGEVAFPARVIRQHRRTVLFGKRVSPFSVGPYFRGGYFATYPKRPYLLPALEDASKRFPEFFEKAIDRAIGSVS